MKRKMHFPKCNKYGSVDCRDIIPEGFALVSRRWKKRLDSLHIEYREALVGFVGEGKYGFKPALDFLIPVQEKKRLDKSLAADKSCRERDAHRKRAYRARMQEASRKFVVCIGDSHYEIALTDMKEIVRKHLSWKKGWVAFMKKAKKINLTPNLYLGGRGEMDWNELTSGWRPNRNYGNMV